MYVGTEKYRNYMKNMFVSVDQHKGALLLALFLALRITGSAKAYVIKEDADDTTTDISKSEFTTQITFETTVTEETAVKTVTSKHRNYDNYNPAIIIAPQLNTTQTKVKIESIAAQTLSPYEFNHLALDLDVTTISTSTTNSSNIEAAFDEINEIKPISTQVQDEIELVRKDDIFSSDLFPHSKLVGTNNENETNTENLEETIRNSVKNEIEVEQNFSSSALLDVLQDIPELQIRRSLADEILLNTDMHIEEEKQKQTEPVNVSIIMRDLELQETIDNFPQDNAKQIVLGILEVQTPSKVEFQPTEGIKKNHLKIDNVAEAAKLVEEIQSSILNLHKNVRVSHESSVRETSPSMEYNRDAKNLKKETTPQNNDLNVINNSIQFQANEHILQTQIEAVDGLHSKIKNILVDETILTSNDLQDVENSILSNVTDRENSIEMDQQDQVTSQPFSIEIKESISPNDDFTDIPPILSSDTNELTQDIISIDKATEATEYIENELENAAASGDSPHFIIKKQGVEDVRDIEDEKNETDYLDIVTESFSEVTHDNGITELVLQPLTKKLLSADTDVREVLDSSGKTDFGSDDNKITTNELAVIQPPSDSMSSNNPGAIDELSEALLSHSIKDAIYPYPRHSTLILCSISALLLLFLLLTIFLKLERHRGTLNIEMQEQRCGKDQLDEEFEKCLKLLDVELSIPAPTASDESVECLQTSST